MDLIGYVAAALIGVSLGLIGAGGSILTLPVLVFLFGIAPAMATSYSLFIVGITSLLGAVMKYREGNIEVKTALIFGGISTPVVLLIRKFVVPAIPVNLYQVAGIRISYGSASMILFSLLMVMAGLSMTKKNPAEIATAETEQGKTGKLIWCAISVGTVTGLLGAGGGFLIIPGLVMFFYMDMKKAIGTSLGIIALNTLPGFIIDTTRLPINWPFLLTVSVIAISGSFAGAVFSKRIKAKQLKVSFGWFVLALGLFIFLKEGILAFAKLINI